MPDTRVLVNGKQANTLSVMDRGLAYGDGLFETIAVTKGKIPLQDYHVVRLEEGCQKLNIPQIDSQVLLAEIKEVAGDSSKKIVKVILTRGNALRGYNTHGQEMPTRIVMASDWQDYSIDHWMSGVRLRICDLRLAWQPALAGIKHLNRLEQVLARSEWDDPSIHEGIMLDSKENIIEATSHNIFMVKNSELLTPDLSSCGVAGIMRRYIIDKAKGLGINVQVKTIPLRELDSFDELFLCNSIHGIWPICEIEGRKLRVGEITSQLRDIVSEILPYTDE